MQSSAGYRNNFNNSNRGFMGGGNLNYGGGSGRIPPHQNQDPYFYPLFPDRQGQNGSSNFFPGQQGHQPQQQPTHHQQSQPQTLLGCSSSSSSGSSSASSSASSSGSNPWSFGDADAELFLQDILTVGLSSKAGQSKFQDFGTNSDLGLSGTRKLLVLLKAFPPQNLPTLRIK